MKKTLAACLIGGSLLALPAVSSAQAGIFLGLQGGVSVQKPSLEDVDFNTDTTFVYGLKAGVKLLMFVVEVQYFQAAHNISLGGPAALDWDGRAVDYNHLGVNLKYIFSLVMVHPYLSLGYGYYTADIHNIDKDKDSGYNLGAGVEVMLGKKFSITAEGRYHHVSLDIQELGLGLGDFTLAGGFNFYF